MAGRGVENGLTTSPLRARSMWNYHATISILITAFVFITLQFRRGAPVDLLFLGALIGVTVTGVIEPSQAIAGFANPAVITIGALLTVSAGLQSSGVLDWVGNKLLGTAVDEKQAMRRLSVTLVGTSVFLLNTALVAMMVPVVVEWCRKRGVSPSRVLIPVSYFAILGGVCSLIGTSTTLIVNAMLKDDQLALVSTASASDGGISAAEFAAGVAPMTLFEIGRVGLPCALIGSVVLLTLGRRLLPNRTELVEDLAEKRREYLVEMLVTPDCRLIGQTVEAAGLRKLPGLFLIEIDRDGDILTPVSPENVIRRGDRLVFVGVVGTIVDLEKFAGLVPAAESVYSDQLARDHRRNLFEAVLSRSSPLIGTTVKAANFRRRYNAAVVAVHRDGERLSRKIGDIRLEPGDTILLQTRDDFAAQHRNSPHFYLVSGVEGYSPRRHDRALTAGLLGLFLVLWLVVMNLETMRNQFPMLRDSAMPAVAGITIAGLMIVTRCVSVADARAALNLQVLLTIVGALGLGEALKESGAARDIATLIVFGLGDNPTVLLIAIYILALLFTELITNNAVATILLPLAISVAAQAQLNPRPFVMAIALAASLSFLTPIGYQTNLMVMGPGGYRPRDFLRVGLPVAIAVTTTAIILIPWHWPF